MKAGAVPRLCASAEKARSAATTGATWGGGGGAVAASERARRPPGSMALKGAAFPALGVGRREEEGRRRPGDAGAPPSGASSAGAGDGGFGAGEGQRDLALSRAAELGPAAGDLRMLDERPGRRDAAIAVGDHLDPASQGSEAAGRSEIEIAGADAGAEGLGARSGLGLGGGGESRGERDRSEEPGHLNFLP